jgi:hypothetical protein
MDGQIATNVRLERDELRSLKTMAAERGVSLARLFRTMVSDFIARARPLSDKAWKSDPFFTIGTRPGRSGLRDLSIHHDKYLYQRRKARS